MRVDTNTKGHTNWYYFTVSNKEWIGSAKFNICNFRRERSLYQRVIIKPNLGNETICIFREIGWRVVPKRLQSKL